MFGFLLLAMQNQSTLDFYQDIEPILRKNCFECHGIVKQKGGFRIDIRATAMAGSDFGESPVIIPGNADESDLYWAISSTDLDERMPPEEKGPLQDYEISRIKDWINQGALWPDDGKPPTWPSEHWAYQMPKWPRIPQLESDSFSRNTIDQFVFSKLTQEGFYPSAQADFQTLARRTALDITGLPPSSYEVGNLLEKGTEVAWQRWLDILFDSLHYGENQALSWLDLSRYADSNGFEVDHNRSMSPWRDWVIDAFNQNMPFDEFTAQQLAGDLMESPSLSQIVATGFHRNTMTNTEGGVDDEEYRVSAVVDRVNTTASVWLGTTMSCVQCHDHKYDPLTSNDYYSMYALFNDGQDGGTSQGPKIDVLGEAEAEDNRSIQEKVASLQSKYESLKSSTKWSAPETLWVDESKPPRGHVEGDWTFLPPSPSTPVHQGEGVRKQVGDKGSFIQHFFNEAIDGPVNHGDDSIYAWIYLSPEDLPSSIMLQIYSDDWEHRAYWGEDTFSFGVNGTPSRFRQGDLPKKGEWVRLDIPLEVVGIAPEARINGIAFSQMGGTVYWDDAGILLGEPQISVFRTKIAQLEKGLHQPLSSMIVSKVSEPRMTHVLEKGSFLSPGKRIAPGVPKVFNKDVKGSPRNRLEFSKWLTHPKNPLTSRVIMNRLWEQVFGVGLVATSEDFGTRGEVPSHPELLDWLALEFQRQGWNLKAMHRLMIDSATYRQTSSVRPEVILVDPNNRLLSWFPRVRLKAEVIRDQALAVSGLLVGKIGGPSVFPYQPKGIDNSTYAGDRWKVSPGEDRYRRGIYTFWRRTSPYPMFQIFDAPSREISCARRTRSNTPLQALALLNDPVFVEAAKSLGALMQSLQSDDDRNRITFGFRRCTSRGPDETELKELLTLLESDGWTAVATVLLNLDETVVRG